MDPNSQAKRIRMSIWNFKKNGKRKYRSFQRMYLKHMEWMKVKEQKKINQASTNQRKADTTLFIQGEKTSRQKP